MEDVSATASRAVEKSIGPAVNACDEPTSVGRLMLRFVVHETKRRKLQ
jgi:hypothetical protein